MAKPSIPQMASSSSIISSTANDNHLSLVSDTQLLFQSIGSFQNLPEVSIKKSFFSDMIRDLLKVDHIERGRVSCSLTVTPHVTNAYGTLHGGAVAIVAELVAMACARTIVDDDKDLFLGELAMSYLSSAGLNVELEVDGCIVRSSRNIMVASVEFRIKETKKVVYTARATFYIMPLANL
ncbi:Thioesterase superfamily [Macleaya cordata]|uniref:Thioesterase superfamily n=1 Tax=Macleaya cordata TaxID=56857 RepID=A0A200QUL3_MACCD|nr:Thioesterase superfamily [Macleaya cordata]